MTKILAAVSLLLLATVSSAQPKEDNPRFTVRWYGQAFFTVTIPSGRVIAFEPQVMPVFPRKDKIRADIVCQSHPHADKERLEGAIEDATDTNKVRVLRGYKLERPSRPWDWNPLDEKVKVEEASYRFRTVGNYRDAEGGKKWGKNATFVVEIEGVTFCHLGHLGHTLSETEVKAIGPVDVLFVPVGGVYVLNGADAKDVVSAIKPKRYIFPMAYAVDGQPDTLLSADEFLDGLKLVTKATESNAFTFDPREKVSPTTIVLGWKPGEVINKK
ncbi:MAG: MBL fold metallo-hydrolase [Planctomycetes bacterium]|nr:MBL fold metallo-hydrolase [Planctomycetota bacterium]MBM4097667.1 MBL fold metallo-hydrolase [Planctomycetota bacterium]